MEWISMAEKPLKQEDAMEVIGFHPSWIDEDFNPNGARVGFIGGEGNFISAKWLDYQDTYINGGETDKGEFDGIMPTHYAFMPKNPQTQISSKNGVQLIAAERQEQLEKHGWDLTRDEDYVQGELLMAAQFCLNINNDLLWPWRDNGVGTYFMNKIIKKSPTDRVVIAGAFCAAELDRLLAIAKQS